MKNLLTILLISSTTFAHGQSWEVGANFGSRLCLNNFVGESPLYNHLLNNELVGETGIYATHQIRKHWALAAQLNYFRITYTQSHFYDPQSPYFNSNVTEYFGTMVTNNIEANIALYYCFNPMTHTSSNFFKRIKNSVDISIGYIYNQQKYKVLAFDTSREFAQTTTQYNGRYVLLGLSYNTKYIVNNHININFTLCFNKSTSLLDAFIPYSVPGYFEPIDNKLYIYAPPEAYFTYKLGIGYTL